MKVVVFYALFTWLLKLPNHREPSAKSALNIAVCIASGFFL